MMENNTFRIALASLLVVLCISSCSREEEFPARDNTEEVNAFYEHHNKLIQDEVDRDVKKLKGELKDIELDDDLRKEKQSSLDKLLLRRQKKPEMFTFASMNDLPKDLNWVTNWDESEIGSDNAKKGGVFHTYFGAFPATLRVIGPESNNGFRGEHLDDVEMPLVSLHPNTGAVIPALADRWAVSEDNQTVYFHIDDTATYSDGVSVESDDFFMVFYMNLTPYIINPWGKQYYKEQFWNITRYDAKTFSITLSSPKPLAPYYTGDIRPMPRHFYKEVGPDFDKRYNWRVRPTTGGYGIKKEGVLKGRSITLSRVENWWAKDRKYTKNRCNVDKVVYQLVRDGEKALQLFKKGQIDFMPLNGPKSWYEKTEFDAVFDGYIEKATFYNDYPAVPIGLYFNCSRPLLDNRDIRVGLQYATNWDKVIAIDLRGDASRCETFADGFGRYSHPDIRARRFSIKKAAEQFAKAGFTKRGNDGIFVNDQGARLSFVLSYSSSAALSAMMSRLKEEAIKAGVEFKLEALDGSAAFSRGLQKKHEITLGGWGVSPPFPVYYEFFNSKNAFEKGSQVPKPMTNNFSVYGDAQMDILTQANRDAKSEDEVEKLCHQIEEIIHRDAPWIPAYKRNKLRCGYWRWVKWPDDFNIKLTRDLYNTHIYWIDEEVQKETLHAMRNDKTFPEKNLIFDQYQGNKTSSQGDGSHE